MGKIICVIILLWISRMPATSQDTFSIVAADSTTREVASAGASCVDLIAFGISDPGFLGDLFPDTGAINTQASYEVINQRNARARMRDGLTPSSILTWLFQNDTGDNPAIRQYGVVGFTGGSAQTAGFTGANCIDYKNHITGHVDGIAYSIQGNILMGPHILDSMESRFRHATGDLACRMMAALQGANVVGADTRCTSNESSSLFAFLKVAQPTDAYGQPSLNLGVSTRSNTFIEPVDSLQVLFNAVANCTVSADRPEPGEIPIRVYPNPTSGRIYIDGPMPEHAQWTVTIYASDARVRYSASLTHTPFEIDLRAAPKGLHHYRIESGRDTVAIGTFMLE